MGALPPVSFLNPAVLAVLVLVPAVIIVWRRGQPTVAHSDLSIHENLGGVPLAGHLSTILLTALLVTLVTAAAQPVMAESKPRPPVEQRDLILAADFSISMTAILPAGTAGGAGKIRRLDAAERATCAFVEARQGDRVALLVFDQKAYFHWPLTDHLKIILQKCLLLSKMTGAGTNFDSEDGPIQTAIDHFKERGQSRSKVIIMVTDGEAKIAAARLEELVSEMNGLNIRLYVLGIGESWTDPKSAGAESTQDLRRLVERLQGRVFAVATTGELEQSFAAIDALERSPVELPDLVDYREIYHYLALAAALLAVAFLLSLALTGDTA